MLAAVLVLAALGAGQPGLAQQEDLEKEFFQGLESMERDYRDFEKSAFEDFRRGVEALWGDFVASTKKDWVEYSDDRRARSRVDFEKGEVLLEVVLPKNEVEQDPAALAQRLSSEIQTLVSHKGKSRDYALPAESPGEAPKPPPPLLAEPVLKDQLRDASGEAVTSQNAGQFAREVLEANPVTQEPLQTPLGSVIKAQVRFALVPEHLRIRAERYLDLVRTHSRRFAVSVPLVFAVMHTESYFNPKATSPAPAHGLMQLVPRTGGRDAYRYVYGRDRIPSADYLYQPANNIELGCAYLRLLSEQYFGAVRDPQSSVYVAVASYNTGPGNLAAALCGKPLLEQAAAKVNSMAPAEIYRYLLDRLPYEETRDYLRKVTSRMALYEQWRQ